MMYKIASTLIVAICMVGGVSYTSVNAQELVQDKVEIYKAEVLNVLNKDDSHQSIRVRIVEGIEKGKEVTVDNDYAQLKIGDRLYLRHSVGQFDGTNYYSVDEPYRLPYIIGLVVLFFVMVLLFGGKQGVRGVMSLIGSLVLILYVLIPGILNGYSPLLVTIGVSTLIIVVGSYVTHGFNKTTSSAVLGMMVTVIVTGLLAYTAVHMMSLTGYSSEEVMYVNLNAQGSIDIIGLLLGGIMIGLLGVLYDVAIGQAVSVEELLRAGPHLSKKMIYDRAIRIGREHIGALVNTLAIAYVGASLPLLLLFSQASDESVWMTLNRELFATEIVRTMIGSIGLILAVPLTTLISVYVLMKRTQHTQTVDDTTREPEKERIEHVGHTHN